MTTPAELQAAPAFLMLGMQGDVTLSLALAAAWLDPVWFTDPGLVEEALYTGVYEEDPGSLSIYALTIARRCFPRTYCELVEGLRMGWDFSQIGAAFGAGVRRAYPYLQLDSLFDLIYGVPVAFVGLDVTSPDFLDDHPDFAALLAACFDLHPTTVPATRWTDGYPVIDEGDFEALHPLAVRLIHSLVAQDCQPCADLAFLLMYLFSCTGNSLLDFSADTYADAGFEPLEWEQETLETANEACREMSLVLDAVERARRVLAEDEELSRALKANLAALKAAERIEHVCDNIALYWPEGYRAGSVEPGAGRDTGPDAALLFLRSAYAETD